MMDAAGRNKRVVKICNQTPISIHIGTYLSIYLYFFT